MLMSNSSSVSSRTPLSPSCGGLHHAVPRCLAAGGSLSLVPEQLDATARRHLRDKRVLSAFAEGSRVTSVAPLSLLLPASAHAHASAHASDMSAASASMTRSAAVMHVR